MSKQPTDKGTTMAERKEMAVREKKELAAKEEKTIPGRYYIPYADIYETEEALAVVMEMPGVDKKDLDVQVKGRTLRLSGEKKVEFPEKAAVHRRERLAGRFDRALTLPVEINPDGVKAEYRDGILALFLPQAESAKAKSITIG